MINLYKNFIIMIWSETSPILWLSLNVKRALHLILPLYDVTVFERWSGQGSPRNFSVYLYQKLGPQGVEYEIELFGKEADKLLVSGLLLSFYYKS